ncbi:phosphoribosyltransferase family protein [Lutimonas halocynthiae]|nr:phosphoribosyltransferase family protein [Lutimonas halocynthiae]
MAFIGRIPLKAATSLFYFERKGAVQKLIHQLKYQGKSDLGIFFGLWLAREMEQSNRFEGIDFVIPVPMHPKKEKERGYNQVIGFASAIAKELQAELRPDVLLKVNNRKTQTSKNRFDRLKILENDYKLHSSDQIKNAHILLVDDIITSGATIEACGIQLMKHNGVQLSLASMAFTP